MYEYGRHARRFSPFPLYHSKNLEDSCKKNKNFGQKMSLTWYHKNIEKHIFLPSPPYSFISE
ncbi:hypothetical protein CW755_15650 [Geobacillus thermodenitrificans]|nr:hypothetical protein [Geobacillus thermodenitrificans]NNU85859.1 hypothetical protein [Geobacillus sp. MR]OQP09366.1 hypothetical protein B1691_11090 [Geobacillus sp. 47C-IIb]PJW22355.1 hypothetical protein CV632_03265 [Geobacillus thermodenitrificans]PTR46126.1 hypothetical protein CW755_15650 [Geobacillus thermodenitrificans]